MISMARIDQCLTLFGLLFFIGTFHASITTFDNVGGADSAGNANVQMTSGLIYLSSCLVVMYRTNRFLWSAARNIPFFLFMFIPVLSIAWSVAPDVSLRRIIALLGTTLFGLYLVITHPPERVLRFLATAYALTAVGSVIYIFGLPRYGIHDVGEYAGVWRGVFDQKNKLGGSMALGFIIFTICPVYNDRERLLRHLGIVVSLVLVIMSESRSAWMILAVLSLACLFLRAINGKGFKTMLRILAAMALAAIIAFLGMKYQESVLVALGKDPTLTGRTGTWEMAWDRALERPYFGYGYRAFWTDRNPARLGASEDWRDKISHAHNTYLDLLLDIGFVGGLAFLVITIILLARLIRRCMAVNDAINHMLFAFFLYIIIRGFAEITILQQADITWVLFSYSYALLATSRTSVPRSTVDVATESWADMVKSQLRGNAFDARS